MRYTFPVIKFKKHVYAIGGREFGDDKTSIMNYCERFDLEKEKWEMIGNLNENKCTSKAFVYKDKLFAFAGYKSDSTRSDLIELFDEKNLKWLTLGVKLPYKIEASLCL